MAKVSLAMHLLPAAILFFSVHGAAADPVAPPTNDAVGVFGASKGDEARIEPGEGALPYTVRFELPNARGLAQPSLSLTYHSVAGDSDAGYGWTLDLPVITASPLSGWAGTPPNGAASETRYAADGSPLVAICTTGAQTEVDVPRCSDANIGMPSWATPAVSNGWTLFLAQTDTSSSRYFLSPNGRTWRVQRKGGVLQDFGEPIAAPNLERGAVEERDGTPVRWRLVRQLESARPANLVVYRWQPLGERGLLYLTDVWDTPRAGEAADLKRFAHHTALAWEELPFSTTAYAAIERAVPDRRLARVTVASADWEGADTRLVTSEYRLGYYLNREISYDPNTQAPLFHHTFLREVRKEGRCRWRETAGGEIPPGTECTALPPVSFRYQGAIIGGIAGLTTLHGGPPNLDVNFGVLPYLNSASVVDFNRDGLPDVVQSWEAEPRCFNQPGNVRVIVTRQDGTPDPVLVCYNGGGPQIIRSARPITGWLNTSTGLFLQSSFTHQCMDAGDGTPGTIPWFVRQTLPGGPRLASFLASQGAATLLGNYGDGILIWGAGDSGYRPFRAVPATIDPALCPTPATSPGWVWAVGTRDGISWPKSTGAVQAEDAASGPRWFADVDGDGLADSLGTGSGPRVSAFLRGTTPFFTRRYGVGEALPGGGSGPAQIPFTAPGDPVSLVPDKDAPAGTRYFYTDVNGDGLVDLAYFRPAGPLIVRPGDGRGRFACDAAHDSLGCNGEEIEAAADAPPWTAIDGPDWDNAEERFLHDVTGDGLADIVTYKDDPGNPALSSLVRVWVNLDGHNFRCVNPTTTHPCTGGRVIDDLHGSAVIGPHRVEFADMDGDGSDDVVVLARQGIMVLRLFNPTFLTSDAKADRAGLLVQVDNGVGATTDVHYETIQRLMADASAGGGQPWAHMVPAIANVVTAVRTHNQPTASTTLPKPYSFERRTRYTYRDPAYDPWTRAFLGFRQVDVRSGGESAVTRTTYWYGPCQQSIIVDACLAGSDDEPDKPLVGLPVRIDRLIPEVGGRPAQWLASTELYYENRLLFDRRRDVRRAVLGASETYEYDPKRSVSLRPPVSTGQGGAGDPRIHSPVQDERAPVTVDYTVDDAGNVTRIRERGRQVDGVDAALSGAVSHDDVVVTWLGGEAGGDLPGPYRCNSEHWHCFVDRLTITTDQTFDHGYLTERQFRFGYTPQGDLEHVDGWLNANFPRLLRMHAGGGSVAPLPPGAASGPGWKRLATYAADPTYGGAILAERPGAPSTCTTFTYDPWFRQFPKTIARHKAGCSSPSLDTRLEFDRGFGLVSRQEEPSGAITVLEYDPFGRLVTLSRPNPDDPDPRSVIPALTLFYSDRAPLSFVEIRRHLGGSNPTIIDVANGLGERPLRFVEDDGHWIVEGWRETDHSGLTERAYPTLVAVATDPRPGLLSASVPASTAGAHRIDAFHDNYGRLTIVRENGTRDVASFRYRPFEVETRNASQLLPGASGFSIMRSDGRNRPVEWIEDHGNGESNRTSFAYALTGELTSIRRGPSGGTDILTKIREFDSLGRMVAQKEPNSGRWIYAWDDGSRLIGTSDARGCGVNFHYDGLDRLVGEDYSPCTAEQALYTPASPATGVGFEKAYAYDAYDSSQLASDSSFLDSPALAAGQLVATRDRAAETRFSYDNRGRVRRIERRLALPSAGSAYAPTRYFSRLDYDIGNRLTRRTTGAPAGALAPGGASEFTFSYTLRDQVKRVTGSFGTLIDSVAYEPDGLLTKLVYGDLAATTASFTYDPSRRLASYTLGRVAPSAWSAAVPGYTLPGPDTAATDLLRLTYAYNPLGDPVRIEDLSAAAWPAANVPQRRRDIGYDAASRLQSVRTTYPTASGDAPWETPFRAEAAVAPDPLAPFLPLVDAPSRPRSDSFDHDTLDTLTAANSDLVLPFDRSLSGVTLGSTTDGPQRLGVATGVQTAYDAAGNLVRLALDRAGHCPAGQGDACDQWFAFEWDEVGQLARARRWDFTDGALRPAAITDLPTGAPTFERINRFSAGRRIWSGLKADASPGVFDVEVFPTFRLEGASFAGGDYVAPPERQRVLLPGLATVLFDHNDRLPRRSQADRLHTFLHLPDALGSHAVTIDRATGEVAERTVWTPFGATENDFRPARWSAFRAVNRFAGNPDDPELGLVDFGARLLSPYLMRFISPDPLVQHAAVVNANSYAYARGRPFSRYDLSGLVVISGDGGDMDFSDEPDRIYGYRERAEDAAARAQTERAPPARISAETLLLGTAHIPIPFTEKAYFTPNGVRKVAANAAISALVTAADPLNYRDIIEALTGAELVKPLMLNVGEDKDDKSKIVGTGLIIAASLAAGGGGGGGGEAALLAEDAELMTLAYRVRGWRFWRTVAVTTTRQGPRLVSGGASPLSASQIACAEECGLIAVPPQPGWHAEGSLIFGAGEMGYTPVRGVVTSRICVGCMSLIIEDLGGVIGARRRTFYFPRND